MKGLRPALRIWLAVLAAVLVSCGPVQDDFASDVERELDRGRAYASELVTRARVAPEPSGAVAVGYLERHRLGLGSPFRLIEYALQDPRLEKAQREQLAWSLLAATVDGTGYRVDPRAMVVEGDLAGAVRHLELIEGAIEAAPDPEGGVLAVRLAYAMAAAENTIRAAVPARVSQAAALIRDRAVAREDARRLLRAAGTGTDPLSLVSVWRVERRFRVEAPTVLPVASDVEQDAIALAPRLLEGIRTIHNRPRVGPLVPAPEARQRTLLSPDAARTLAAYSAEYNAPPQTPVLVSVNAYRNSSQPLTPWTAAARSRFFDHAVNEERLAAEHALLQHSMPVDEGARLGLLRAAVALRAYAQERPWFPGFGGPAERDLEERFGLAGITFDEETPAAWRPYYRRMLESSLSDLQRVLPALDVRGLRFRFSPRQGSRGTLAVHDPRTRTIHIPVATGAGTIAHEVAHDLDWQTALRRYNVRGDYASDRAVRLSDERLASVLRGLTTASLRAAGGDATAHASRPAEVFARSMDWFVAVALAREGRLNGYLSSVQDDVLTGYGTVTPPDVSGTAGQALITLLDDVAPVYPETRRWFLESYGRSRAPTAYDLARRVLEAPLDPGQGDDRREALDPEPRTPALDPVLDHESGTPVDSAAASETPSQPVLVQLALLDARLDRLAAARDSVLAMVADGCSGVGYDDLVDEPRRRLVGLVAEARARGMAMDIGRRVAGAEGGQWVESRLRGRHLEEGLEPVLAEAMTPLLERVEAAGVTGGAGEACSALSLGRDFWR